MTTRRVHIRSAVNAAAVSKAGGRYTIKDVCGAVDDIVMNGVLYPAAELATGAPTLEGKPAPAGHPRVNGRFVSASSGEALLDAYIGAVCTNARHVGGRTLVDVVVNEAQAKAHADGAKLVERLDAALSGANAEPIHVSTGLFFEAVAENGESKGKRYSVKATKPRYDHLAILLNERGAGTPEEGVGMWLNAEGAEEPVEVVEVNVATKPDVAKAVKSLRDAIDLHERHMDGTEPTTGADGEKSQMKMMRMMKAALAALAGGTSPSKSGMSMRNVASFPEDRRSTGFTAWLHKLVGNGSAEVSFDQITSGLYALMPDGAWLREVFDRYAIYCDRDGKCWQQDYSVSSDGSVAWSGTAQEVRREVRYVAVNRSTTHEADAMRDTILAALNKAGISTAGKTDEQLLADYNAISVAPVQQALNAANDKVATFEANQRNAEAAEVDTLAKELATNSTLSVDDFKALGLNRLRELKAAGKPATTAAPVVPGGAGTGGTTKDEFASYSINALIDAGNGAAAKH